MMPAAASRTGSFALAIVTIIYNPVPLPQRISRHAESTRLFRSGCLLDGIPVFGAGLGPGPSASCCTDSQGGPGVKPRVAPKKPRTVLIWNTPSHRMAKDPHKCYCIPYGEEGMRAIGEASGAFEPVVSDDIAMYTPEHIRQFDAIILNNASGPWITPTDADLAKPALKKLGIDAQQVESVLRKSLLEFLDQGGGVLARPSRLWVRRRKSPI